MGGEAKTSPATAAVSMPVPTYPACAGSCPLPPPVTMEGIKNSGREDAIRKQGDGWNGVMKVAYLRLLLPCFHLPRN